MTKWLEQYLNKKPKVQTANPDILDVKSNNSGIHGEYFEHFRENNRENDFDYQAYYHEIAGIYQYDQKLELIEAERLAMRDCLNKFISQDYPEIYNEFILITKGGTHEN